MTAGPIDRAFRFVKSAFVSCGGVGEGVDVGAANDGVALAAGVAVAVLCGDDESVS